MMDRFPLAGRTDEQAMGTATDAWLTASEAAGRLGVSVRTVRRWATEGRLAGMRIRGARGTELRFLASQVAGFRLIEPEREPEGTRNGSRTVNAAGGTVTADVRDPADQADERDGRDVRLLLRRVAQLRAALVLANRDRRRLAAEVVWLRARIQSLDESLPDRVALALTRAARPWWRFW